MRQEMARPLLHRHEQEDDDEPRVDCGERNASGCPASSSQEVPGRLNFNVPLTPGTSVKLEVSSGDGSKHSNADGSASAPSVSGSASEHDFPCARREPVRPKAKAMNKADDEVWVSGSQGYCYHKAGCGKLNQSHTVTSTTRGEAETRGYRGCRICRP